MVFAATPSGSNYSVTQDGKPIATVAEAGLSAYGLSKTALTGAATTPTSTPTSTPPAADATTAAPVVQTDAQKAAAESAAGLSDTQKMNVDSGTQTPASTDSGTGGNSFSDVFSSLQKLVPDNNYDDTASATADQSAKDAAASASKEQNDVLMQQDLDKNAQDFNTTTGTAKNHLAQLGILGTSTAATQYLADLQTDKTKQDSLITEKYNILNSNIDAAEKQTLLDDANTRIKDAQTAYQAKVSNLLNVGTLANTIWKNMSDAEQAQTKNALDEQQAQADAAYKSGTLTIDEYNAETTRIKAQADAITSAQNANSSALSASASAENADTNRMTALNNIGADRPSIDDFATVANEQFAAKGIPFQRFDASDPQTIALYNQLYPTTVKQATAQMTTEQKTRAITAQDAINNKGMTYEQAKAANPDIAFMLLPLGMTVLHSATLPTGTGLGTPTPAGTDAAQTQPDTGTTP